MISRNPYINNPVANSLLRNYHEALFENEKVDALLSKICDNALNIFKILNFDLAKKADRNPDVMRVKLSDIANSKSVKELTAKLLDYADDSEISNNKYAEVKRLYLDSLNKFCEALNRAAEIGKDKGEFIIKRFKITPVKIQTNLDLIAKQAEAEDEKIKKAEEDSLNESFDFLNENIFTGYKGRVKNLRKTLVNLITSAEGKDQKNGYGRDWKRTFIELDQKRQALDSNEGGEKDKKMLEDLEKQVEKYQDEFNKALINASNKALSDLENDEEVYTSYSDVTELNSQALDELTRAQAQYSIVFKEIKDEHANQEDEVSKAIFPLKRGDNDSDKKIKGSGLIFAIQNALINGIPPAARLLKSKGAPNGKYGPATQAIIATLQKGSGNKNVNGEIDKTMLANMISSDWVSQKDKTIIRKALDTIRSKSQIKESFSFYQHLTLMEEYFSSVNEEKIIVNNSEFEKELNTQYKTLTGNSPMSHAEGTHESKKSAKVQDLAKMLRGIYNIKIESDDFTKSDGSLKSYYSPEFITAWKKSLESLTKSGGVDSVGYFFTKGGVYSINLPSTSLKTPCNWHKWADVRQLKTLSDEDAVDFINSYLKGWTTFGRIRPSYRYDAIRSNMEKISENSDNKGAYEMLESAIKRNGETPFINYEDLRGDVADAFKIVLQMKEKSPDLKPEDFQDLNNFLILISNCVSFKDSKFISCVKWIQDNIMGESTCKRLVNDSIGFFDDSESEDHSLLGYESSRISLFKPEDIIKKSDLSKSESDKSNPLSGFSPLVKMYREKKDSTGGMRQRGMKYILGKNLSYISYEIYPSMLAHIKRMNATTFEDLPQEAPFKCLDADNE